MTLDPTGVSPKPFVKVPELIGKEIGDLVRQLGSHSDREAAIVGHSLLDAALERAIKSRCIDEPHPKMFSQSGPLATFNNKIIVGYSLGLVHADMKADFKNLSEVRNRFAHSVSPLEFTTKGFKDGKTGKKDNDELCSELRIPDTYFAVSQWISSLSPASSNTHDNLDSQRAFIITDGVGNIGGQYFEAEYNLALPKDRYIASIHLHWLLLTAISYQTNIKPVR